MEKERAGEHLLLTVFFFSNKFAYNLGENIILQENFKMLTRDVEGKLFL
jgi:hypothetical protein